MIEFCVCGGRQLFRAKTVSLCFDSNLQLFLGQKETYFMVLSQFIVGKELQTINWFFTSEQEVEEKSSIKHTCEKRGRGKSNNVRFKQPETTMELNLVCDQL